LINSLSNPEALFLGYLNSWDIISGVVGQVLLLIFSYHSMAHNQYPHGPKHRASLLIAANTPAHTKLQQLSNQARLLIEAVLATQGETNKFGLCFASFTNEVGALKF
jgi:hypothetical protein